MSGFEAATTASPLDNALSILTMLVFIFVGASLVITYALIARHLYRSFIEDGGQASFPLPASIGDHLISKIIMGLVWLLINVVSLALLGLVFIYVNIIAEGTVSPDMAEVFALLGRQFSTGAGSLFVKELLVLAFLGIVVAVVQLTMSVIVGGITRSHKVLAEGAVYIGGYLLVQIAIATTVLLSSGSVTSLNMFSPQTTLETVFNAVQPVMVSLIVLLLAIIGIYYLISWLALNKLSRRAPEF